MIEGVAIKVRGLMVCLPRPNRHHHCIQQAVLVLKQRPPVASKFEEQGFYTDDGCYLTRTQAFKYAKEHGIPFIRGEPRSLTINGKEEQYLLSEDLW